MALTLAVALRNTFVNALGELLDVGGAGSLEIYDNATPGSGVKQADMNYAANAYDAPTSGGISLSSTPSDNSVVAGDGTPGSFQAKDGNGAVIFEGTAGGGGSDLVFDVSSGWAAGATAQVTQFDLTAPS